MKNLNWLLIIVSVSFARVEFYHGAGLEMSDNGVGVYYEPQMNSPVKFHSRIGMHFERSNVNLIQYPFNSESPGYKKTMFSLMGGSEKNILNRFFAENLKIGIFAEGGVVISSEAFQKLNDHNVNERIIAGIGLQFPGGKSIRKFEFAIQNPNRISGIFLVRFRVTWFHRGDTFG